MALLDVCDLVTRFATPRGGVTAVDRLSFSVAAGETVAIVGESGSGKSATAMSIMRLLETPPAQHAGQILFEGRDLLTLPEADMRGVRGNRIGMVFQEPMTALNPVQPVGAQIAEGLRIHRGMRAAAARQAAVRLLGDVGIPAPEQRSGEYPHMLSGGMRQRVMIAMAMACDPPLLIADEPTTALDVTIQGQILNLIRDQQARLGTAIILITHDLGVVANLADRVIVLYAGRKVEEGTARQVLEQPRHPYTQGLLGATPRLGGNRGKGSGQLVAIPGTVPLIREPSDACSFGPRCPRVIAECGDRDPALRERASGHLVACCRSEWAPTV